MKTLLTIGSLSLAFAATGAAAQGAPPPSFDLPHAYDGYSQPEITNCTSVGASKRECTVPAMTAGRYLIFAVGNATSTGADATQAIAITVNGQPCMAVKPTAFTGKKSLAIGCEVQFLTDKPMTIDALYSVKSATPDAGGPQLAFRRTPWNGVVEARGVVPRPAPAKPAAPAK